MGGGSNGDAMGFKHGDESGISCPSSGVEMTSMPMYAKPDTFLISSDWDPIVSLGQNGNFGGSTIVSSNGFSDSHYSSLVMDGQGMSGFVQYPSGSSYVEMPPKLPSLRSSHPGFPDCSQIAHEDRHVSEERPGAVSPNNRKRKKPEPVSDPSFNGNKKAVDELQKGGSRGSADAPKEPSSKKPEKEQNTSANSCGKQTAKETNSKDNSKGGEAPKETYIHVRARRGQATNSHSLAERVRREKISERMRLLQDLVPGCNKITGKAVMLDEIINYVQSLQQQVEFLSMKLATVNPELNFDIDRIFSKDILHSRGNNTPILGFGPGTNPSHPYGVIQGTMPSIPSTNSQFPQLPQTVLDTELQSLFQMGFISNSAIESLAPNGRLKPEL